MQGNRANIYRTLTGVSGTLLGFTLGRRRTRPRESWPPTGQHHDGDQDDLRGAAGPHSLHVGLGEQERAIFKLYAPGVMTGRDEWVYDFEVPNLRNKALFFADHYNELLVNGSQTRDAVIEWSRDLRNELRRGRHIVYSEGERIQSLYRPYTSKWYCANFTMNDVLTTMY